MMDISDMMSRKTCNTCYHNGNCKENHRNRCLGNYSCSTSRFQYKYWRADVDPQKPPNVVRKPGLGEIVGHDKGEIKAIDNWADREKGMVCNTCMYFVIKDKVFGHGRCRRKAPTMKGWPVVFGTDWCGDHKLK
jgi:hypothetical protein